MVSEGKGGAASLQLLSGGSTEQKGQCMRNGGALLHIRQCERILVHVLSSKRRSRSPSSSQERMKWSERLRLLIHRSPFGQRRSGTRTAECLKWSKSSLPDALAYRIT